MMNIELLIDGKQAFPMILTCIDHAKESIYINMFIWRDDMIGNRIASALLEAADRGVKIYISKDRYGNVLEYSEEDQSSFFHDTPSLKDKIKIFTLAFLYNTDLVFKRYKTTLSPLAQKLYSHPNISIDIREKFDHSKFYIFDNEILILGGINVEDKENGADRQGRVYQDYMVKIVDRECIDSFLKCRETNYSDPRFSMNLKGTINKFEIEQSYLDLINDARESLLIVMAYFSPVKSIMEALEKANQRGVKITLVMPKNANFTDDLNKKMIKELMKITNGNIEVYLSDKMVHTKLLMSESKINFGSANISKKAFYILDELNLVLDNDGSEVIGDLRNSVNETIQAATRIYSPNELKENKILSALESILM